MKRVSRGSAMVAKLEQGKHGGRNSAATSKLMKSAAPSASPSSAGKKRVRNSTAKKIVIVDPTKANDMDVEEHTLKANSPTKTAQSPPKPARPEPTRLMLQRMYLTSAFRCLDMALLNMAQTKKLCVWERVKEYVQQLSRERFDEKDLALVLSVWPGAFTLNWRTLVIDSISGASLHLCIEATNDIALDPTASSVLSVGTYSTKLTERMTAFENMLSEILKEYTNIHGDHGVLEADMTYLPKRPDCSVTLASSSISPPAKVTSSSGNPAHFTSHDILGSREQNKKIHARNELLRNIENLKASAANTNSSIPVRQKIVQPPTVRETVGTVGGITAGLSTSLPIALSMENLRHNAANKEIEEKKRNIERVAQDDRQKAINRVQAIAPLCDALRSYIILKKNAQTQLTETVLEELSHSFHITEVECLARLKIISRELPQFLTFFAPDDVVAESTLRVNLSAPYADLRQRALHFTKTSMKKINDKYVDALSQIAGQ